MDAPNQLDSPRRRAFDPMTDDLANRIDRIGIERVDRGLLARWIATARHLGGSATMLDLLADDREPAVARQRAFGRVSADLDRVARGGGFWLAA